MINRNTSNVDSREAFSVCQIVLSSFILCCLVCGLDFNCKFYFMAILMHSSTTWLNYYSFSTYVMNCYGFINMPSIQALQLYIFPCHACMVVIGCITAKSGKDLIIGHKSHLHIQRERIMTDEAVVASRATLTCEDSSYSQATRWLHTTSLAVPSEVEEGRGRQSATGYHYPMQGKFITPRSHSPELLSQIFRKNKYCLKDWAHSWKRTHGIGTQHSNTVLSEGSRTLTPSMEKIHHPHSQSLTTPLLVSTSWIWKDDPVEIKERKSWQRSYSDFMHSPYFPKTQRPPQTPSRKQLTTYRVARCRAWLNSHCGWLQ